MALHEFSDFLGTQEFASTPLALVPIENLDLLGLRHIFLVKVVREVFIANAFRAAVYLAADLALVADEAQVLACLTLACRTYGIGEPNASCAPPFGWVRRVHRVVIGFAICDEVTLGPYVV